MNNKNLVLHYAEAVFSIAKKSKKVALFKKQILFLINTFKNNDYLKLLNSPFISFDRKEKALQEALGKKIDKNLFNLICILIQKKSIFYLEDILIETIKIINKHLKIDEGIIYTPFPISDRTLKEFEKKLSKKFKTQVFLERKIDKQLVFGFKIIIQNHIIENTLISNIKNLKKIMLEKNGEL